MILIKIYNNILKQRKIFTYCVAQEIGGREVRLWFHIVSHQTTSYPFDGRGFQENRWKRGWVEYLILIFYLPREHFKSNVQSIRDIISFRIYDTYFHHDIRGHGAGVTLPRSMRVDFFFAIFLQIFPLFLLCIF